MKNNQFANLNTIKREIIKLDSQMLINQKGLEKNIEKDLKETDLTDFRSENNNKIEQI